MSVRLICEADIVSVRLLDEYECNDRCVEKIIFYVDLTEWEMLRGGDGEEDVNGGVAADGCEGLIKINDVTLIEPSDNLAGFKSFDGAVSCSLVTEDPLVGEDASPLQRSAVSEDPCFAGFESSDFNVHSCAPFFGIGTCEGMARGFGFNPFWWAGDNYVEAEDVKSGEAGVVPLIACDFHHIVVRAVAAGGCGAEKRVAQGIEWSVILVVVFVAPWAWAGVGICGILIRERCLCFVFGGGEATRWALVVSNVMFSPSAVSMAVALELADGEIFVEDDVAGHDYARGAVVEDVPGMVLGADAEMHAPTGAALEFPHGHCCWPILHHAAPDAVHGNVALVAGELEVRREVVGVGGGAGKIVETDSVMHGVGPVLRVNVALLQEGADPGHESAVGALSDALLGMSVGERELVDDSLLLQVCCQLVTFELCCAVGLPHFEGATRLGLSVGVPDPKDVIRLAPVRDVGHPDEARMCVNEGEGVFLAVGACC
ncbi:unnamed protein product [Closterium sp. NIES-53]